MGKKIVFYTTMSVMLLVFIMAVACKNKSNNQELPKEPSINKMVVYYETSDIAGFTKYEIFDTLKIEKWNDIKFTIKFFDSTTGQEIDKTTVNTKNIEWKNIDSKIMLKTDRHDYSITVAPVIAGLARLNVSVIFDDNKLDLSVWFNIFNSPAVRIDVTPTYLIVADNTKRFFQAKVYDKKGLSEQAVKWQTSDSTVAAIETITDSTSRAMVKGMLPALNDDAFSLISAYTLNKDGPLYSNYSTLRVVKPEVFVERIDVVPDEESLIYVGSSKQFTAQAFDAQQNGHLIENASFSWQTSDTTIATVDPKNGMVYTNPNTPGNKITVSAFINNTKSGKNIYDSSILNVVDSSAIYKVSISPAYETTINLENNLLIFSASAYNSSDKLIEGVPFKWYSSDEKIATIDSDGKLVTKVRGEVQIYAEAPGGKKTDNTTVHIVLAESKTHTVSRISGQTRLLGLVDGAPNVAKFNFPYAVVATPTNEIYIADTYNNQIRKIDTNNMVSYIAGNKNGSEGKNDKDEVNDTEAYFNHPRGIDVDSNGVIYVSDTLNHQIKKVTPSSGHYVVSLIAGSGFQGYDVGVYTGKPGKETPFSDLEGVVLDSYNNPQYLYAADSHNNCIYRIELSPPYTVRLYSATEPNINQTPIRSDWVGDRLINAGYRGPTGLARDAQGNIYIADTENHCIKKISGRNVTIIAGDGTPGNEDGKPGKLILPKGVAVDPLTNIVYIADTGNCNIRKIDPSNGALLTVAGRGDASYNDDNDVVPGNKAGFDSPLGISIGTDIIVADSGNYVIKRITK